MRFLFTFLLCAVCSIAYSQTGINWYKYFITGSLQVGADNTNKNDSGAYAPPGAWVSIGKDSTNRGLLFPRVVHTDSVVSPVRGLVVYSYQQNSLMLYTGSVWAPVGGGAGTLQQVVENGNTLEDEEIHLIGGGGEYNKIGLTYQEMKTNSDTMFMHATGIHFYSGNNYAAVDRYSLSYNNEYGQTSILTPFSLEISQDDHTVSISNNKTTFHIGSHLSSIMPIEGEQGEENTHYLQPKSGTIAHLSDISDSLAAHGGGDIQQTLTAGNISVGQALVMKDPTETQDIVLDATVEEDAKIVIRDNTYNSQLELVNWGLTAQDEGMRTGLQPGQLSLESKTESSYTIFTNENLGQNTPNYINGLGYNLSLYNKITDREIRVDADSISFFSGASPTTSTFSLVPGDSGSIQLPSKSGTLSLLSDIPVTTDDLPEGSVNLYTTSAERVKLAGIEVGATANETDAYLLDRDNHTGTQSINTIIGLQLALDSNDKRLIPIKTITSAYTLDSTDLGFLINVTGGSPPSISVGTPNSLAGFPAGWKCVLLTNGNTGVLVSVGVGTGQTLLSADSKTTTRTKGSMATLIYLGGNVWVLSGDIN